MTNCLNSISQAQSYNKLNIQELANNIDTQIEYINQNKQDSIFTISQILYDINLLNQLKFERHDSISNKLILKLDSTKTKDKIALNLIKNSIDLYLENFRIINKDNFTDTIKLINEIKKNLVSSNKCISIINDIINNTDAANRLFTPPLNLENISEYYNLEINTLSDLCKNKSESSKSNKTTVKKGYSPFSNEYQNFIIYADSINKEETKLLKTSKDKPKSKQTQNKQEPTYSSTISSNNNSLFITDLIKKYDKESLIRYWRMYQNQDKHISFSHKTTDSIKSPSDKTIISTTNNIINSDTYSELTKTVSLQTSDQVLISNDISEEPNTEFDTSIKTKYFAPNKDVNQAIYTLTNDNNTYYFIQIAASRTPISNSLLKTIYKGNDSIIIKQEEGWYKYQLGKTTNYTTAQNLVQTLNIAGAFITAYKNNQKQILWKTINTKHISNDASKLVFVVQVSANIKPINIEQRAALQKKAGGFVREINEDGWYKYQYVVGSSYKEALNKWKKTGTDSSFIAAYYDGQKIAISKAIKIYNKN